MSDTLPDVPATHDTIDGIPAPSANPALFGHPSIRSFLAQAYQSGHMHHALLLEGPQGVGKTTLAFHLAGHMLKHPVQREAPLELALPDFSVAPYRQIATGHIWPCCISAARSMPRPENSRPGSRWTRFAG